MNLEKYQNTIFIIKDESKKDILNAINSTKQLLNIKLITLSELKEKYFFSYDTRTTYEVMKSYKVNPDIARTYIENMYYPDQKIESSKVEFLHNLKCELEEKNLLKKHTNFKDFLKGREIVLFNLDYVDNFYHKIFKNLEQDSHVIKLNSTSKKTPKLLYAANNKKEEISYVADKIVSLIKSGIDIDRIKLANVQSDYKFYIRKIFREFNIPVELPSDGKISETLIGKKFKELYESNIENTMQKLKGFVSSNSDEKIYKMIIDIVNDYVWVDDFEEVKDMIMDDLNNRSMPNVELTHAVRTVQFPSDIIDEKDYIFLLNFNQGIIPINHKNEDYLSDQEKLELGISTSTDLNIKDTKSIQEGILTAPNLTVTYSKSDLNGELYISSAFNSDILLEQKCEISNNNSNDFNLSKLTILKDENRKYGTVSEEFFVLTNHYKDQKYLSYDNRFKGIDKEALNRHLKNKLSLSYSSMNSYYECAFKYYLNYILKVDKYEDNFATVIGNIFHDVLSKGFSDDFDFNSSWNSALEKIDYEFNNMEKYFLNNLKEELKCIRETIISQMEYCSLDKNMYEKEIIVPVSNHTNVTFKGIIDKLMYKETDTRTIAAIIDYKTGNPELSINNAPYGIGLQLPVYIYLLKNFKEIKNVEVGGFYLQKILPEPGKKNNRSNNLKWQGYSNSDLEILKDVDSSYQNSEVIKSLKMTSNGFSNYSKVLSSKEIDKLSSLVENKIEGAAASILNAEFPINPKMVKDKNISCKYCKFKDICYVKNRDIVSLDAMDSDDFLGGDK